MFIHLVSSTLEPFAPPSSPDKTIMLRVPTPAQREQLNARMMALGLTYVSEQKLRMTVIDELWTLYPEVEAEEKGNFLDSVWLREEAQNAALARWQEQEVERLLDQKEGAPDRPADDMPPRIVSVRESAKAQLLYDDVTQNSPRVRNLIAERMDFGRRNAVLLVRIGVASVGGMSPLAESEPGILSEAAAFSIRDSIGDDAWAELIGRIDALYSLGASEEKNSDLPPEKPSDPTGLPGLTAPQGPNDGFATVSSITPVPTAESETTTGQSLPGA